MTDPRRPVERVGDSKCNTRRGLGDPATKRPPARHVAVWWAFGFSSLTTLGLGALIWFLVLAHAMAYGVGAVVAPEVVPPLDGDRYRLALAVGVVTDLAGASSLTWAAAHTPARSWPPAALGLAAALVGAVAGAGALLMTLGMNPVGFVLSL